MALFYGFLGSLAFIYGDLIYTILQLYNSDLEFEHFLMIIDHFLVIIDHFSNGIEHFLIIIDHFFKGIEHNPNEIGAKKRD